MATATMTRKAVKATTKTHILGLPIEGKTSIREAAIAALATPKAGKAKGGVDTAPKTPKARKTATEAKEAAPVKAQPAKLDVPHTFRVIHLPAGTWEAVKDAAEVKNTAARHVISDALTAELPGLVAKLQEIGFRGEERAISGRQIRAALNESTPETLNAAREKTGVAGSTLLRLCLELVQSKRGGTKK